MGYRMRNPAEARWPKAPEGAAGLHRSGWRPGACAPKAKFLILALVALLCAGRPSYSAESQSPTGSEVGIYGRFGIGIKSGECAGALGAQLSLNITSHWQASLGVGGVNLFAKNNSVDTHTNGYFALGRYYLEHLYFATGYVLKITRAELDIDGTNHKASASVGGIPLFVGYEFGDRLGFFVAGSAGLIWVPDGGGQRVQAGVEGNAVSTSAADTGPSLGLSVGYYFW